jgi:hypothetical protein
VINRRLTFAAVLLVLASAGTAGAAVEGGAASWVHGPRRAVAGNELKIEGRVPSGTRCSLSFKYKNGAAQKGLRQVGRSAQLHKTFPPIANIRVGSDRTDAAVVGSVEGEVVNDNASKTMERSQLGMVVLDAGGNILGGRTGSAFASLPPGAREFFKITGMRAVALDQAASAIVSVTPQYRGERLP